MARENHQPRNLPSRPNAHEDYHFSNVLTNTIACILANSTSTMPVSFIKDNTAPVSAESWRDGNPLPRPLQLFEGQACVSWAASAALHAGFEKIVVLTAPEFEHDICHELDNLVAHTDPQQAQKLRIEVRPCQKEYLVSATRELHDTQLFGIQSGVLQCAWQEALKLLPECEGVAFLAADNPSIGPWHLAELIRSAAERPHIQAATSWVVWLRRLPLYVTRSFFENLREWAASPLPRVNAHDHVFGEEVICANDATPDAVGRFFSDCSLTALQAVTLAKWMNAHPDETPTHPNATAQLIGPAASQALSNIEQALIDAAARAIKLLPHSEDLSWADEFGARNKLDFPLLCNKEHAGKLAYLDTAATAQRLDRALAASSEFDLHGNANVYRGAYSLSAHATFAYNDARAVVEKHLGAKRRSVVFTANTTAACNLVASAWGEWHIGEGDVIVTSIAEHHSNMLPFMLLAQRKGARVHFVPLDERGHVDEGAYEQALKDKPKLVCIAHVGNMLGIEAPVARLAEAAHDRGARVLVDAAQSFPHLAIDVNSLNADWLAFSGHKAYGPMGSGGLWISQEAFDEMDPTMAGGGTVSHVSTEDYYLRQGCIQYELGTPAVSQSIGLAAAISYLDALGMDNVARHSAALTHAAACGLEALEGVRIIGKHDDACGQHGIISFALPNVSPAETAQFLGQLGVAVRSGGHCALPLHAMLGLQGSTRISIGIYNTSDDIAAALAAIDLCRQIYEGQWHL